MLKCKCVIMWNVFQVFQFVCIHVCWELYFTLFWYTVSFFTFFMFSHLRVCLFAFTEVTIFSGTFYLLNYIPPICLTHLLHLSLTHFRATEP